MPPVNAQWLSSQSVNASASANWNGMSDSVKYTIDGLFLYCGQFDSRPWSQASCASGYRCGVPAVRISAKLADVSLRCGASTFGLEPVAMSLRWYQTVLPCSRSVLGTGIGNGSAKPRTPAMEPK